MPTIITEEDAKSKLCPFSFAAPNTSSFEHGPRPCKTKACMAWQKEYAEGEKEYSHRTYQLSDPRHEPKGGYCKLIQQSS